MIQKLIGVVLCAVLVLQGCSTMNAKDCQTANWHVIGQKDGEKGELPSTIGTYIEQCSEFNVIPDDEQYAQGYQRGLLIFCTTESGFEQGKRNKRNNGLCPAELQEKFNQGYQIGTEYFVVNSSITSLESNIRSNKKAIERIEKKLKKEKEAIKDSDNIYEATNRYLDSYDENQKEVIKLEEQIKYFEQELAVKRYQYQELVKKYGYK